MLVFFLLEVVYIARFFLHRLGKIFFFSDNVKIFLGQPTKTGLYG